MRRMLRIFLVLFVILLVAALIAVFSIYRLSQQAPSFYHEALAVEPAVQEKHSDAMLEHAATMHNSVRHRGTWKAEFTEEEINGWLAVDLPRNHPHALPPGLDDPRIRIEPNEITIACKGERNGIQSVVSLKFSVYLDSPEVFGLRIVNARIGALPWPLTKVLEAISDIGSRANLRVKWAQAGGDPVALITVPAMPGEHEKPIRLQAISIEKGRITVAGATDLSQ